MRLPLRSIGKATVTAALLLVAVVPRADAQAACGDHASCLDAILAAARAGHETDEIAAMHAMRSKPWDGAPGRVATHPFKLPPRPAETLDAGDVDAALVRLVRDIADQFEDLPEYQRALALTYLKTKRLDDARRLLEHALVADPVYAPYWMDLAIVYARQGLHERAVAALVVAHTWAADQAALLQAYGKAAGDTPEAGMGQDYASALQAIAANTDQQARADSAAPARPAKGSPPDPSRKPALIDFNGCDKPDYPKASLRYQETGAVTLEFLVGADGAIQRFRKLKSSGHPQLDNAAEFSLASCRFHPATLDGKPIPSWQPVQYVWTLE